MPNTPKSPANLDEFNAQARSFVAKAKAKGLSNTAMANTIRFMYGQFQEDQKSKITPYQQALLDRQDRKEAGDEWELKDVNSDGTLEWVNKKTQEVKESGYGEGVGWEDIDVTDEDTTTDVTSPTGEVSLGDSGLTTTPGAQPVGTPDIVRPEVSGDLTAEQMRGKVVGVDLEGNPIYENEPRINFGDVTTQPTQFGPQGNVMPPTPQVPGIFDQPQTGIIKKGLGF